VAKRGKATSKAAIGMALVDGDKFLKQLEKLVVEVQLNVVHDAIEAGTKPVLAAMIPNTPESSGSRDKQSKKTKQRWSGSKKLKNSIRAVVRKRTRFGIVNGAIGLIGPDYKSGGGHGNLFSQRTHKRTVFWGREVSASRAINQFVKRTADQTKSAAMSALRASLKSGIDKAARKTTK
jgi:hypothetical protein